MTERVMAWVRPRAPGVLLPLGTTVLAFFVGGLAVAATGHNPLSAYRAVFNGTGLNYVFPWISADDRAVAAINLQQTLIVTCPLILTALAVAFAFRCGMFNIGGQGQYLVGIFAALYVGLHFQHMAKPLHIGLAMLASIAAGSGWAAIAGALKAAVGAHEVISTIMLNWIAIFGGQWLFELGGPLQGSARDIPRSNTIAPSAQLPGIWGNLQPLHAGIFAALGALVVYWFVINRTTLGFEVRTVGRNPDAARYAGISVSRNYVVALAIAGGFAGLAGACDLLGWEYGIATNDIVAWNVGFIGIAVALLGRNKAFGVLMAALLFGGLQVGTSPRQLDPSVFPPELASNLATIIQGLIILFVGAELILVYVLRARKRMQPGAAAPDPAPGGVKISTAAVVDRIPRGPRGVAILGIVLGLVGMELALPPLQVRVAAVPVALGVCAMACAVWSLARSERKLGLWAAVVAVIATVFAVWVQGKSATTASEVVNAGLVASTLTYATPLGYAAIGGIVCERSGVVNIGLEGMMLTGAFFGIWGAVWSGTWTVGLLVAMVFGGAMAFVHAIFAIHLRADQIVSGTAINFLALGITGYLFIDIYGDNGTPGNVSTVPNVSIPGIRSLPGIGTAFGDLNLMIWLLFVLLVATQIVLFRTPLGLRIRSVGEHPQSGRHGRHPGVPGALRGGDRVGHAGGAGRGVSVHCLRRLVRPEHDQRPRVHRSRGGHLRQVAALRRLRGVPSVRLRQRAGRPPADRRQCVGEPALDAALRVHPDRPGGADRALAAAGRGRLALRQGLILGLYGGVSAGRARPELPAQTRQTRLESAAGSRAARVHHHRCTASGT